MRSEDNSRRPHLISVASVGLNNELGRDGDLCWHISEDLRHFKELTMGGAVIMGRKTWESLPKKPLPGRLNIVVTGRPEFNEPGALRAGSLEEALSMADDREIFIIGGESIYRQAMPFVDRLELTRIYAAEPAADKYFPEIPEEDWKLEFSSDKMESKSGFAYRFERYVAKAQHKADSD